MTESTADTGVRWHFWIGLFCAWRNGQKNSQQVEDEKLNQELLSLDYIFLGSTGAIIKMFSKAFKHWCFSNLSCLKPSLKTQLLTGSLNFKKRLWTKLNPGCSWVLEWFVLALKCSMLSCETVARPSRSLERCCACCFLTDLDSGSWTWEGSRREELTSHKWELWELFGSPSRIPKIND